MMVLGSTTLCVLIISRYYVLLKVSERLYTPGRQNMIYKTNIWTSCPGGLGQWVHGKSSATLDILRHLPRIQWIIFFPRHESQDNMVSLEWPTNFGIRDFLNIISVGVRHYLCWVSVCVPESPSWRMASLLSTLVISLPLEFATSL